MPISSAGLSDASGSSPAAASLDYQKNSAAVAEATGMFARYPGATDGLLPPSSIVDNPSAMAPRNTSATPDDDDVDDGLPPGSAVSHNPLGMGALYGSAVMDAKVPMLPFGAFGGEGGGGGSGGGDGDLLQDRIKMDYPEEMKTFLMPAIQHRTTQTLLPATSSNPTLPEVCLEKSERRNGHGGCTGNIVERGRGNSNPETKQNSGDGGGLLERQGAPVMARVSPCAIFMEYIHHTLLQFRI